MITLSPAGADDDEAILAIYNDVIATSTAVYSEEPATLAQRREWRETRQERGFPVLVAKEGSAVVGFGSFGEFRAFPCYARTVEHSIHIHADWRGQGIGRLLLSALVDEAVVRGKHVMIAGIDANNAASLALHESLGFARCAHMKEVGRKFGRWLDLVFMQRVLP